MKHLVFVALSLLVACKKAPNDGADLTPTKDIIGEVRMIDYISPRGEFTCLAPADWKANEYKLGTTGDESHFSGNGMSIFIGKNANAAKKTAEEFANSFWLLEKDGKKLPIDKTTVNGREVFSLERTKPVYKLHSHKVDYIVRERFAIIQCGKDYYQIGLSAKPEAFDAALPVFESVVKSFKPQS